MKAEIAAVAKVRPVQSFDQESGGWCSERDHSDTTHVGSVVLPGGVVVRVGLCDEHARQWIVKGQQ